MNSMTKTNGALDSREVAGMVGKQHKDLLRDIGTYARYMNESTERKIAPSDFFVKKTYADSTGRTLPRYDVTRKGCEMIANKLTGQKGVLFTAAYINRFHEMEQTLPPARQPGLPPEQKRLEIEARHKNACAREASMLMKLADKPDFPQEYRQILYSQAAATLTGQKLLPLPETPKQTYSATEVGERYGLSANKIGSLANQHGLKSEEYGLLVWDKSRHSAKQVQTWRYYDTIFDALDRIIEKSA